MKKILKKTVGRPSLQIEDAAMQAIAILEIGCALSMRRMSKLQELGYPTEQAALAFINKRHRGLIGLALGDSIKQSHFPQINKTAVALRCIVEDGMPVALVARHFELDRRNLVKALPRYRKILAEESAAIARVAVSDVK